MLAIVISNWLLLGSPSIANLRWWRFWDSVEADKVQSEEQRQTIWRPSLNVFAFVSHTSFYWGSLLILWLTTKSFKFLHFMFFNDKWARNKFIDKTVTSSPIDKTISFSSKSNWKLSSFSTITPVSGQLKKKSCMWFFTLVWLHNRAFAADWLLIVLTNCLKPQACPKPHLTIQQQ